MGPPGKRRRPVLWVTIVLLALLLFGGSSVLTYALIQPQTPSLTPTLQAYCRAVLGADAQGMYQLLSQQAQKQAALADSERVFTALNTARTLGLQYSGCTFNNLHVSGALAVATVVLTISISFQGQRLSVASPTLVSLVLEENQWKIDFSSFAQPQPGTGLPGFPQPGTTLAALWPGAAGCTHRCRSDRVQPARMLPHPSRAG